MSMQNLISLVFTDPQLQSLDNAIAEVERQFEPLIALTPQQRRSIKKMGEKSERFCRQALHTAQLNQHILMGNLVLADAVADLKALDQLRPRLIRLLKLTQRATDSETALGSDVMAASLRVYAALKISGSSEGLDPVVRDLGNRFARPSRKEQTAAD